MTQSTLRQVLTIFETVDGPLALPQIARELDVSIEQLEGMIQHWIRKGKIREGSAMTECGACGHTGAGTCPFVMDMPRSYELVRADEGIPLPVLPLTCEHIPAAYRGKR